MNIGRPRSRYWTEQVDGVTVKVHQFDDQTRRYRTCQRCGGDALEDEISGGICPLCREELAEFNAAYDAWYRAIGQQLEAELGTGEEPR